MDSNEHQVEPTWETQVAEILACLPRQDCGLCRAVSCATFAKGLVAGDRQTAQCPRAHPGERLRCETLLNSKRAARARQALLGADWDAFQFLWATHWNELEHFVLCRGVPVDEVVDLVQDAYLVLWQRRHDIEQGKQRAFLFATARNLIRKHWERPRAQVHPLGGLEDAPAAQPNVRPLESSLVRELIATRLPPREREALLLVCFEGLTRAAAAQKMGVTPTAVSHYKNRGIARLRRIVAAESGGGGPAK